MSEFCQREWNCTTYITTTLRSVNFWASKKYYNTACSEWLLLNSGKPLTIYDVAECVGKAYRKAFFLENIQSEFRVSGIYPLNRNVFGDHEFLSSYVTDRIFEGTSISYVTALPFRDSVTTLGELSSV